MIKKYALANIHRTAALFALCVMAVFNQSAAAQSSAKQDEEERRGQFFVGYSFTREDAFRSANRRAFGIGDDKRNLQGFNVAGTYYLTSKFGVTADFSAHFNKEDVRLPAGSFAGGVPLVAQNTRFKTQQYNYLIGPQVRFTNNSRVTPFARVLVGGQTNRLNLNGGIGIGRRKATRTNFAVALGGGVDVRVSERIAIRAIQVDYLPSFERNQRNFFGTGRTLRGERRDDVRLSFGVVF